MLQDFPTLDPSPFCAIERRRLHTKGREIEESGFEVALYDIAPLSGLRFRTLLARAGSPPAEGAQPTPFEANRSIRRNSSRLARDSFVTEGETEREERRKRLQGVSLSLVCFPACTFLLSRGSRAGGPRMRKRPDEEDDDDDDGCERASVRANGGTRESLVPRCPDASMRRPNKRERSERAERDAQEERIRNRSRAREGDEEGKGES